MLIIISLAALIIILNYGYYKRLEDKYSVATFKVGDMIFYKEVDPIT